MGQNLRYLFGDYHPKVYFKGFWDPGYPGFDPLPFWFMGSSPRVPAGFPVFLEVALGVEKTFDKALDHPGAGKFLGVKTR